MSVVFLNETSWIEIVESLHLSPREAEIARLILEDATERSIAGSLNISSHTVHTHVARLYSKLCVSSHCQVAVRLFQAYVQLESQQACGVAGQRSTERLR